MGVILSIATIPPHIAAEEAWMSITALHPTAMSLSLIVRG